MKFTDWYTDTADIFRVVNELNGALTVQSREQVAEAVPCRVARHKKEGELNPGPTAADYTENQVLMCDNSVDIQPGDELILHRGAKLGKSTPPMRAFAGEPTPYYEPFGAVIPGLAHQEVPLLSMERI